MKIIKIGTTVFCIKLDVKRWLVKRYIFTTLRIFLIIACFLLLYFLDCF